MSRPEKFESTNVEEKSSSLYIFFIINPQNKYFFSSVGRGGEGCGWLIFSFFLPLFYFSLLFSPYFSTDVKMIEIPAGLITVVLQRTGLGLKVFK